MKAKIIAKDGEVLLREFTSDDIPLIAKYANNEKISRNLTDAFPNPYSPDDAQKFLDMVDKQDPKTFFAIEYQGKYAGNISLSPGTDIYRKSAEIGYFIGEPCWNQGIATRAISLMIRFGFENLDIVRIHCGVFSHNMASMRVLEKCGFVKEGVFRQAMCKKGEIFDAVRYAVLKEEFDSMR